MNATADSAARTKSYFLSDAHLGAAYIKDARAHEARIVEMLTTMGRDAEGIYLLGDILDFWFEYSDVVPRGHTRLFGTLAALTDAGVKVYWFRGNHDMWTYSYLSEELGVTIVDEELVTTIGGKTFFLSHGDGLGKLPRAFGIMRAIFRNRFCQRVGRALHPSWLLPFAFRWSSHNRTKRTGEPSRWHGIEREQQMQFAIAHSDAHPEVDYYVTGHRHVAIDLPVPGSHARFVCLGDCFQQYTYAVFDGTELSLDTFHFGRRNDAHKHNDTTE